MLSRLSQGHAGPVRCLSARAGVVLSCGMADRRVVLWGPSPHSIVWSVVLATAAVDCALGDAHAVIVVDGAVLVRSRTSGELLHSLPLRCVVVVGPHARVCFRGPTDCLVTLQEQPRQRVQIACKEGRVVADNGDNEDDEAKALAGVKVCAHANFDISVRVGVAQTPVEICIVSYHHRIAHVFSVPRRGVVFAAMTDGVVLVYHLPVAPVPGADVIYHPTRVLDWHSGCVNHVALDQLDPSYVATASDDSTCVYADLFPESRAALLALNTCVHPRLGLKTSAFLRRICAARAPMQALKSMLMYT